MSGWKPYLDLVKKGDGVKSAGIYGQDGSTWAADGDFNVSPAEVKALSAGLKAGFENGTKFSENGVVAGGVKYMYLRNLTNNSIIGRKGPTSIIATLSKKALIVLLTKDGANPANITSHTFVADDLTKKNF